MKVLFAVNNEAESEMIIKKFQNDYKQIVSSKNVFYFNAILKELQKDKSYDAIVISEDLEYNENDKYDQRDRNVLEKLDKISDEAIQDGRDIPIIVICSDRRYLADDMLNRFFGMGIYNALLGSDRSVSNVCRLLKSPRTKKEAKEYYNLESDISKYIPEKENDVSELEIQNICSHYKQAPKNDEEYLKIFDRIAEQYNDAQLRTICRFLPTYVQTVLEEKSDKYNKVMVFTINKNLKNTNEHKQGTVSVLLQPKNKNNLISGPVVVPSAGKKLKMVTANQQENSPKPISNSELIEKSFNSMLNNSQEDEQKKDGGNSMFENPFTTSKKEDEESQNPFANQEMVNPFANPEPVNPFANPEPVMEQQPVNPFANPEPVMEQQPVNPFANPEPVMEQQPVNPFANPEPVMEQQPVNPFANPEPVMEQQPVNPFANPEPVMEQQPVNPFANPEPVMEQQPVNPFANPEPVMEQQPVNPFANPEPVMEQQPVNPFANPEPVMEQQPVNPFANPEPAMEQQPVNPFVNPFNNVEMQNDVPPFDISNNSFNDTSVDTMNYSNSYVQDVPVNNGGNTYVKSFDLSNKLIPGKKLAIFVGTTKNGTSFVVNNLAELMSNTGIKTAILDTTTNRNSYYIYTNNDEKLRNIATDSFKNLSNGVVQGIEVNKNLTVFTGLPGTSEKIENIDEVLSTLVDNFQLVLIDADFNTNPGFFAQAQEIYLVQSMDILTIQPLTEFLKDLKEQGYFDDKKARIILNKNVKLKQINEKTIIGGMSCYNNPSMSYMAELFDKDLTKFLTIPFDVETYVKYMENVIFCNISLKGYSKQFINSLKELGNMVYPVSQATQTNTQNVQNQGYVQNDQMMGQIPYQNMNNPMQQTFYNPDTNVNMNVPNGNGYNPFNTDMNNNNNIQNQNPFGQPYNPNMNQNQYNQNGNMGNNQFGVYQGFGFGMQDQNLNNGGFPNQFNPNQLNGNQINGYFGQMENNQKTKGLFKNRKKLF